MLFEAGDGVFVGDGRVGTGIGRFICFAGASVPMDEKGGFF